MKKYRISVNGQTYDVAVEELGAGAPAPQARVPAAAPQAAAPASPAAAPAPAAGPAVAGALTIKSPMPGTVMSFKVIQGQAVKRGDVVLILEAMKMENEIVAPQDGTVASIRVPQGAAVNTGDPLIDLA
ncbi:MAG TPA: biotin/lipoyl-binding protein [Spirochaetales bacterium]|nr:biotin/lipoyl-binding protein [Spirochaetales bacterium]